jgi:general secretion pathway protein G
VSKKGVKMRKAFTMLELVFVIAVIGILAAVAVPKFSATRDDATITRASSTLASIRSAISQEAQRRQMEGNYTAIKNLGGSIDGNDKPIFNYFDYTGDGSNLPANLVRVLDYPPHSCLTATSTSCWMRRADSGNQGVYVYKFAPGVGSGGDAMFKVDNNRFDCVQGHETQCRILER